MSSYLSLRKVTHLLIIIYFKNYSKKIIPYGHKTFNNSVICNKLWNLTFFLGMRLCLVSENAKQESKINSVHDCPSNLIFMCLDKDSSRPASEHKGLIFFPRVHCIYVVFAYYSNTFASGFVVLLKTIRWLHSFKTSERFCLFCWTVSHHGVGGKKFSQPASDCSWLGSMSLLWLQ